MKKLIIGIWLLLFVAALELGISIPSTYSNATVVIEDCKKDSVFCKNTGVLELSFTGTYRMQLDHLIHLEMDKNDLVNNDANIFNFKSAFIRSTPVIIQK